MTIQANLGMSFSMKRMGMPPALAVGSLTCSKTIVVDRVPTAWHKLRIGKMKIKKRGGPKAIDV